jgi:hypothetical protein
MKKIAIAIMAVCLFGGVAFADSTSMVGTSGKLSYGLISTDAMVGWDVIKNVDGITARTGLSETLISYDCFEGFVGALSPTSAPNDYAIVGGIGANANDVLKNYIVGGLGIFMTVSPETQAYIGKAARLKAYAGYDLRWKQIIAGLGLGWAFGG